MNRGARRAPIFRDPADRQLFLDWVAQAVDRFGIEVHVYCLMPNHYHLLVRSEKGRLSKAIKHFTSGYVLALNKRHQWDGPVFRGGFTSQLVEDEGYLRYLVAYHHLNPVRANLVRRPEEARWSSAGVYVEGSASPDWLRTAEVLSWFGSRQALAEYTWEHMTGRRLAPEEFCTETGLFRDIPAVPAPVPLLKAVGADRQPDGGDILRAIAQALGVVVEDLNVGRPGRAGNQYRRVAAWVLAHKGGFTCREIGALLGTTPNGVSKMLARVRFRLRSGVTSQELVTAVAAAEKVI